jgi:hypothetical protein
MGKHLKIKALQAAIDNIKPDLLKMRGDWLTKKACLEVWFAHDDTDPNFRNMEHVKLHNLGQMILELEDTLQVYEAEIKVALGE